MYIVIIIMQLNRYVRTVHWMYAKIVSTSYQCYHGYCVDSTLSVRLCNYKVKAILCKKV